MMIDAAKRYNRKLSKLKPEEIISFVAGEFPGKVCFASSLGLEDQAITHMIASSGIAVSIFTMDTGRLFQETHSLIDRTRERYGIDIKVIFPERKAVESMVRQHGMNLFYKSIENRILCCGVRKKEPSKRVLKGMSAWISGLRRTQSSTRRGLHVAEWDEDNGLFKFSPLAFWSLEQVWEYIRRNNVPYNPLHDKGFPSIGCMPCTRAIKPGEDIRSGRWWWEDASRKECGLHE